jgi:hypothetical protein
MDCMRKGTLLAILATCGIAAFLVCSLVSRNREPVYQGKGLSYWVGLWEQDPAGQKAKEAVLVLGTNNFHFLIRSIALLTDPTNSIWFRFCYFAARVHAPMSIRSFLVHRIPPRVELASEAFATFRIMGAAGAPAIPRLVTIIKKGKSGPALFAMLSLGAIGEPAFPVVIPFVTQTNNPTMQIEALGSLVDYRERPVVHAALTNALRDPNAAVRDCAAKILAGHLRNYPAAAH